jgi:hypothetical protein
MNLLKAVIIIILFLLLISCSPAGITTIDSKTGNSGGSTDNPVDPNFLSSFAFKAVFDVNDGSTTTKMTFSNSKTKDFPSDEGFVWALNLRYQVIARNATGQTLIIYIQKPLAGTYHCEEQTFNTNVICIDRSNNQSGSNVHTYYPDSSICYGDIIVTTGGANVGDKLKGKFSGILTDSLNAVTWKVTNGYFEGYISQPNLLQ